MNRLLIAAALCSGMILGFGGVAHAGETTGNGKPTPIATYQAGSICAFSGLNDVPDGSDDPDDPFAAGRVQSFGDIVQEAVKWQPQGAKVWVDTIREFGPGKSCRGFASSGD